MHTLSDTWKEHANWKAWLALVCALGLMIYGCLFIYSATHASDAFARATLLQQPFVKQIIFYTMGTMIAFSICWKDYQSLARWAYPIYWISIALLVLVLIPGIGSMRFGARRWIDLGLFQFQPSELAKLTFLFAMAQFLSRPQNELSQPNQLIKACGFAVLPFLLVLVEPDLGSSIMFLPTGFAMLFIAGAPGWFLKRVLTGAVLMVLLVLAYVFFVPAPWKPIKIPDYQQRRLLVHFGTDYVKHFGSANTTEAEKRRLRALQRQDSYNVAQALISVGSGGLTGKGWTEGEQSNLGYLPRGVAHNDFIFSVIAEEWGLLRGGLPLLAMYGVLLAAGLHLASRSRDRLAQILATGIVTLLFCHVFVNIGMNIRLVPVTGVPLPLVSYGGTSVLCFLAAFGLLLNIQLNHRSK
ncbi:MAG: rod shape-determining protein RodA [Pedosphaera sp.]|nr:rod shape-determining protein RodA [Pedosphaera sp.]